MSSNQNQNNDLYKNPWSGFGLVFSPVTKRYCRLGGDRSLDIIFNELIRDNEWERRVNYMIQRGNRFSKELQKRLNSNTEDDI